MPKKKEAPASPFVPEEEQPYPIPENWCWTYIGHCYEVTSSKRVHKEDNLLVPIPVESEQNEIASLLNHLLYKEEYAKSAAEAVLAQIDTMKKAILARAFRGELGTNDPAEEWAGELLKTALFQ